MKVLIGFAWDLLGVWIGFAWNLNRMLEIWIDLLEIYLGFGWLLTVDIFLCFGFTKICVGFCRDFNRVCLRFAWGLFGI